MLIDFISDHLTILGILILVGFALSRIAQRSRQQARAERIVKRNITAEIEPLSLHPEIDPAKCSGCGACTRVCPEGDIIKLVNHKAILAQPNKCVGHGECEAACPFDAIKLVFGSKTRGKDLPRVNGNYETNIPGLYIAGELGGMGLIRNAVKQGVLATEHALKNLGHAKESADVDLLVVGSGPAGLASSLVAIAQKKSYICVEQNTFGGTVANYPRQKVVMSHPATLPIIGTMEFAHNKISKNQLLEYWNEIRASTGLKVREKTRFENLKKEGQVFVVKTSAGVVRARKVVLAMGVRGTPRKLGLAGEDLPKVTYSLLDPSQYQKKHIAVVGGGNAGVEAAQLLSSSKYGNKVTLLVRSSTFDRCNEENEKKIFKRQKQGLVDIWYDSSITNISPDYLVVDRKGQSVQLTNDFLFIFAGAEMPYQFLMSLGVEIDKKFGEALDKAK